MKQCPLGCGERRLAGAHNSPATLLHLPLHPYHFLTNTETLLTLSPVRTRARSPSRGGKRPGPTALLQAGAARHEGRCTPSSKKNDLFVWISRSGVLFIPSLARKTGRPEDRRARATTGKPRTTMETMAPTVSFPHEQSRERNPSPLPKQRCQLCLPHSHPTPPKPVRSGARGRRGGHTIPPCQTDSRHRHPALPSPSVESTEREAETERSSRRRSSKISRLPTPFPPGRPHGPLHLFFFIIFDSLCRW